MYQTFSKHYFDCVNKFRKWDYRSYLQKLEESQWQPIEEVERENLKKIADTASRDYVACSAL